MRRKRRSSIKFDVQGKIGNTRDGENAIKLTIAAGVSA